MKLSDAIRLGSLLVAEPQAGDIDACAVTMAVLATGGCQSDKTYYTDLNEQWPWLAQTIIDCPCENKHRMTLRSDGKLHGSAIVFIPFDEHVMGDKSMTIEQLADWIASIEPEEAESPATLDAGRVETVKELV